MFINRGPAVGLNCKPLRSRVKIGREPQDYHPFMHGKLDTILHIIENRCLMKTTLGRGFSKDALPDPPLEDQLMWALRHRLEHVPV